MISSLRKKFVLINMALVFVVLAVVFSSLCATAYRQAVRGSDMALEILLGHREGDRLPQFQVGQRHEGGLSLIRGFVVGLSGGGQVTLLESEGLDITADQAEAIVRACQADGQADGLLRAYNLRYSMRTGPDGSRLAFVDISSEQAMIQASLLASCLFMAMALLAFFAVSLFLSRWALRPVERAWAQQRQFVADASHELKTPLTVILANAGILKANRQDTVEAQLRWVENTEDEANRMKELVDSLLFLAKSDDAKISAPRERVNLSDVVDSTLLAVESVAFERGLTLASQVAPGIHVPGDSAQLRRVLACLLDNALKYAEAGGVITVELALRQGRAVLSVHNRGTPLSQEDTEHLFERFYRADKARVRSGYGLGLAIAKSIVDGHRGKITVESTSEAGTTFTVSLPAMAG